MAWCIASRHRFCGGHKLAALSEVYRLGESCADVAGSPCKMCYDGNGIH